MESPSARTDGNPANELATRLDYRAVVPDLYQAQLGVDRAIRKTGFDPKLLELVRVRASQINRCAVCLHVHTRKAIEFGETPHRLMVLPGWRDSPEFSSRERAALAWAEAITLVAKAGISDSLYRTTREHFSENEVVVLTWTVASINAWNRMYIGFRILPEDSP